MRRGRADGQRTSLELESGLKHSRSLFMDRDMNVVLMASPQVEQADRCTLVPGALPSQPGRTEVLPHLRHATSGGLDSHDQLSGLSGRLTEVSHNESVNRRNVDRSKQSVTRSSSNSMLRPKKWVPTSVRIAPVSSLPSIGPCRCGTRRPGTRCATSRAMPVRWERWRGVAIATSAFGVARPNSAPLGRGLGPLPPDAGWSRRRGDERRVQRRRSPRQK